MSVQRPAANSDARKRAEETAVIKVDGDPLEIPAFLRDWLAEAWDEGWRAAWSPMSMHSLGDVPNPYRSAS